MSATEVRPPAHYRNPGMNALVGRCDLALITIDTLRYDVAVDTFASGRTPNLARLLPSGWEQRHTPGSFTYAAHASFFAGFLPTPVTPGPHPRLFALAFPGSETTTPATATFDAPDVVTGLSAAGYHTVCVGGVGFFNCLTPLGSALPSMFAEARWSPLLGVTDLDSFHNQIDQCQASLAALAPDRLAFTFVNVSALHQPNYHYLPGAAQDTVESHAAALAHVDTDLPRLLGVLTTRRPCFVIVTSDHGTAYGEDGHFGHRLAHEVIWNVPYGHTLVEPGEWP